MTENLPEENPEQAQGEEFHLKQIRTFQGDMAEALKNKGETVESLSRRERKRREEYARQLEDKQKEEKALAQRQAELVAEARERVMPEREPEFAPAEHPAVPESPVPEPAPEPKPQYVPQPARAPQPAYTPEPQIVRAPYYEEPPQESSHTVRTVLLVLGTIILLGLGAAGGWYAYTQYEVKTALPVVNAPANQFVTPQSVFGIDATNLSRDTLISTVRTERDSNVPSGSIHELALTEGSSSDMVTTEHLLVRYMLSQAPDSLIRAFDPLFMLGILGRTPGEASGHTFLLIKLDSFENAFPGMLAWEPTMAKDILPLFASDSTVALTASSTDFSDITIQNKDARILKDSTGKTVLLYSFYDNNLLIITDDELSLRQLVSALNAHKVVR